MKTAIEQLINHQNDFKNTNNMFVIASHIISIEIAFTETKKSAELKKYLEKKRATILKFLDLLYETLSAEEDTSSRLELIDAIDKVTIQKELIEILLSEDPIKTQEKQRKTAENFSKKVKSSIK